MIKAPVSLHQIKYAGYDWKKIKHIFVTHKHVDHLMGIIWMVRMITQYIDKGHPANSAKQLSTFLHGKSWGIVGKYGKSLPYLTTKNFY